MFCNGNAGPRGCGGSDNVRARAAARRQRTNAAAIPKRSEGHALGEPGCGREREQSAVARLRRKGGAGMAAGESQRTHFCTLGTAATDHEARRSWGGSFV